MGIEEGSEIERAAARAACERDGELDGEARRRGGVVHTPAPVARFVARCADAALRELGRRGLGDPDVAIVDPACGPGAFLAAAHAVADGRPRVALGLDVDGSAIEKARATLGSAGWPLRLDTLDTLSSIDVLRGPEGRGATVVVLGNPPWAGRTPSRGATDALLEDFREGVRGERKIGVLSDAYVRFFRWSCELVRRADGGGVVALVTNGSFLDGPVHRGMRAALARWFARIDVVDLGGSALVARGADRDDNVFGVRPSVAITVAVRPPRHEGRARVRVATLRGSREAKLAALDGGAGIDRFAPSIVDAAARWVEAPPVDARYAAWPSIADLFPFHREGLQTNRDALCVDADRARLLSRLHAFARGEPLGLPGEEARRHYDPARARRAVAEVLAADPEAHAHVIRVAYRPLDVRWVAAIGSLCHRPRPPLVAAMRRSSLALLSVRKDRGGRTWAHVAASPFAPDSSYLSARSSCRTRAFPTHRPDGSPNLDAEALAELAQRLPSLPAALDVVRYSLATLSAPAYRARFDAALRSDYPRVPPPPDEERFAVAVAAGAALERALVEGPDGGDRVVVGHHEVCSSRLRSAIDACERACAAVVGESLAPPRGR